MRQSDLHYICSNRQRSNNESDRGVIEFTKGNVETLLSEDLTSTIQLQRKGIFSGICN